MTDVAVKEGCFTPEVREQLLLLSDPERVDLYKAFCVREGTLQDALARYISWSVRADLEQLWGWEPAFGAYLKDSSVRTFGQLKGVLATR